MESEAVDALVTNFLLALKNGHLWHIRYLVEGESFTGVNPREALLVELLHERGGVELPLVALHPVKVLGSPRALLSLDEHPTPRIMPCRDTRSIAGVPGVEAPEASELRFSTSLAKLGDRCMAGCSTSA